MRLGRFPSCEIMIEIGDLGLPVKSLAQEALSRDAKFASLSCDRNRFPSCAERFPRFAGTDVAAIDGRRWPFHRC